MTTPHTGDAGAKSDRSEGDSATVGVRPGSDSKQDRVKAQSTESITGETTTRTVAAPDSGKLGTATSGDPGGKQKRLGPAREPRRLTRTGTTTGRHRSHSLQPRVGRVTSLVRDADVESGPREEKSDGGDSKEPIETARSADTQEIKAAESDECGDATASEPNTSSEGDRLVASPETGRTRRRSHRLQPRVRVTKEVPDTESARSDEESVDGDAKELVKTADSTDTQVTEETLVTEEADAATSEADDTDDAETDAETDADEDEGKASKPAKARRRISWSRVVVYGLLPAIALLLAAGAGFLKWQDSTTRQTQLARIESVAAAKESTIALLSYKSESVEKDLESAKNRMTGGFKESYTRLINDVVIPGAKQGHISTTASVPAAASVSATPNHAVVLLYVNQTAVVDKNPPADSTTCVRVTLDKIDGRWLLSGFDPV
ncbi:MULTISPECIES: hypothetical protein [Mycobacterium]|uniref:hypothetical protein n=1 Tax=Mycobacterium TaxID=1763 RepID=UPI001EE16BEB|nr:MULTISPECIES: hypothetical protein [Mycobacterium]